MRNLKKTHERLKEEGYTSEAGKDEIDELENIPAYVRKKVLLDKKQHSESDEVSRYRLTEEGEGEDSPKLRQDNSYLHDNVD